VVNYLTMTHAVVLNDDAIAADVVYPGEVMEGMLRRIFVAIAEANEDARAFVATADTAGGPGFSPRPRRR
jgi:hypothetical protein